MRQFFAVNKKNNILYLSINELNHIKNVLRMKENDIIEIVYCNKKYKAKLSEDLLKATIIEEEKSLKVNKHKKIFYIPVLSEDKMSFVLQKGTEIGVNEFVPILFERCKVKLTEQDKIKKINRWNKIVEAASMQSKRLDIPVISGIYNINDIPLLEGVKLVCSLDSSNVKCLKEMLNSVKSCDTISVLYGPEGGLTKDEEDALVNRGFVRTRLGNNVLRTETVILYVGSIIDFVCEGE